MDAINTINLSKQYKNLLAVDSLNLQIKQGELFSLLGVNGAGKTTTIKMLSCLTHPTSGDAFICGNSILKNPSAIKNLISVSPQETAVASNLTVQENLELICGIYNLPKAESKHRIELLANQFCLTNILGKKASKLSGGYQRRLSIAMALISKPAILFLDEPTLGLDVIARSELWDIIRKLNKTTTIVLTTHYMEEAEALSDRVGIMKDGKLLVVGRPKDLMEKTGTNRMEDAFISIIKEAAQ